MSDTTETIRVADEQFDNLAEYYGRKFFVFTPNVCNASCSFCYVNPLRSGAGVLAPGVVLRIDRVLDAFAALGFKEVRFTGGEPLMFSNSHALFESAERVGLRYSVLTNGLTLPTWIPDLLRTNAKKVTVSVHTLERVSEIFQAERDEVALLDAMRALIEGGVEVAATSVLLPHVLEDLEGTVDRLLRVGVADYKLVIPNLATVTPSDASRILRRVSSSGIFRKAAALGARVRVSSPRSTCLLKNVGSVSVEMPRGDVTLCCATVGDWVPVGNALSGGVAELHQLLRDGRLFGERQSGLPCAAHYGACPIALDATAIGTEGDAADALR